MPPEPMPFVYLSSRDAVRLERVARQAAADRHPIGRFLLQELDRAVIGDQPPSDAVRLDDWVTYRIDWGSPAASRVLVEPEDYWSPKTQLSVLSPEGAALVGLKAGSRMPYVGIEGGFHIATAESLDPPVGVFSLQRFAAARRTADPRRRSTDPDDPGPSAA